MKRTTLMVTGTLVSIIVALTVTPAFAEEAPSETNICVEIAKSALADEAVDVSAQDSFSYACMGDQVVVSGDSDSAPVRVDREIRYADEATAPEDSAARSTPPDDSQESLEVPYTSSAAAANFCDYGGYERTITNEKQAFVYGCTRYGVYNSSGAVVWSRSINWEWTMYPNWPSSQNKLRTIPSAGSPVMSGTFTVKRGRWGAPPANVALSAFQNRGNTTTNGSVLNGTNSDGVFSMWIGDIHIKDAQKNYDEYFDGAIRTHRFRCESQPQRCYYPSGAEAPL